MLMEKGSEKTQQWSNELRHACMQERSGHHSAVEERSGLSTEKEALHTELSPTVTQTMPTTCSGLYPTH